MYEHFSKECRIIARSESFTIQLKDNDDFRLYVVVPLKNGCGMIGRIDKFISPKTVQYTVKGEAELIEEGPYAYVENGKLVLVDGK